MVKKCGNCKYWLRDKARKIGDYPELLSDCAFDSDHNHNILPESMQISDEIFPVFENEGVNCHVFEPLNGLHKKATANDKVVYPGLNKASRLG